MRRVIFKAILFSIVSNLHAVSPPQKFQHNDGFTNKFLVDICAISLSNGYAIKEEWLNDGLFDAIAKIKGKVIEVRYGSGFHVFTTAAENPWKEFKMRKRRFIAERIGDSTVVHVQVFPVGERIRSVLRRLRVRNWDVDYLVAMPDIEMSKTDKWLFEKIVTGSIRENKRLAEEVNSRVSIQSETGRTVYLRLDNQSGHGYSFLRMKGMMPKTNFLGLLKTHDAMFRAICWVGDNVYMVAQRYAWMPWGAMGSESAMNEYVGGSAYHEINGASDVPLAVGVYSVFHIDDRAAFVVYGAKDVDRRILTAPVKYAYYDQSGFVRPGQELTEEQSADFAFQIGKQLRKLHDLNIVHGGVHPGNFGISFNAFGEMRAIIKDFEDSFKLKGYISAEDRAAWKFIDVSAFVYGVMLEYYAGQHTEYLPREQRIAKFMDGYGIGAAVEASEPRFVDKILRVDYGDYLDIKATFPHIYGELLAIEKGCSA